MSIAAVRVILVGLVLPNLVGFIAVAADIGLPNRCLTMPMYLLLAIFAWRFPPVVIVIIYVLILMIDIMLAITGMFGLLPTELMVSLRFGTELHLTESQVYMSFIIGAVSVSALTLWLLIRDRHKLRGAPTAWATSLTIVALIVDAAFAIKPTMALGELVATDSTVESAVKMSGFGDAVLRPDSKYNALIVIVEGLGTFNDPALQKVLAEPFQDQQLSARYQLSSGTTRFYGSTTSAEMRELCDTRKSYLRLTPEIADQCLPRKLRDLGYQTTSIHGYTGEFFNRTDWYPTIGIGKSLFMEALQARLTQICGPVFQGICDRDIGDKVLPELVLAPGGRRFVYWLTLNTHIPIRVGEAKPRLNCDDETNWKRFGRRQVCAITEMWLDVFNTVIDLAKHQDRPLEILVVGDHAPPFLDRRSRFMFSSDVVPWFRLVPRPEAGGAPSSQNLMPVASGQSGTDH